MTAEQFRLSVKQISMNSIRESAHAAGRTDGSWRGILQEIEEFYDYDAWDVKFILAAATRFYPYTIVSEAMRREAAEQREKERRGNRLLKRLEREFMRGHRPVYSRLDAVKVQYPGHEEIRRGGRRSDWLRNLFAGHIGVILGDVRWRAVALALPVNVPPPVFVTVNFRSLEPFTATLPKSREEGKTERTGGLRGAVTC